MPSLLEQLGLLSDATRCRLLRVLETQELAVGELCSVLDLPQSTISRHLKQLADLGWMQVRKEGSRHYYRVEVEPLADREQMLWHLLRSELGEEDGDFLGDQRRLQRAMSERRTVSRSFFSASAFEWDRLRTDMFGERFDLLGLLALLDPTWVIGDLGCGTGSIAATLAQFVSKVIAIDSSTEMLEVATQRLKELPNVDLRCGDLEELPVEEGILDAAVLFLVLQYTASPTQVLGEARRVLKPGAPILVVDLQSHDDEDFRQRMGHLWLGFSEAAMRTELERGGFEDVRWVEIVSQPKDKVGRVAPNLFTSTARTPLTERSH